MKKTLLTILVISTLGFFGYYGNEMYLFAKGVKQDAHRLEKHNKQDSGVFEIQKDLIESKELKEILLTENKLGDIELDKLDGNNIQRTLELGFPGFEIKKEIGQQDGPDFNLYQVNYMNEEIFFAAMDSYDTILVQDIWTMNPKIKDEYGGKSGASIDSILVKRPQLKFYSDFHYNIYAGNEDSKIQYRLKGDFKSLNDSTFFAKDYKLENWQVEGMIIEYLIWRK
jgi:hypothetical protein